MNNKGQTNAANKNSVNTGNKLNKVLNFNKSTVRTNSTTKMNVMNRNKMNIMKKNNLNIKNNFGNKNIGGIKTNNKNTNNLLNNAKKVNFKQDLSSFASGEEIFGEQAIIQANNNPNPLIPIAMGIGGEVTVACTECQKLLTKFLLVCSDEESNGVQTQTLRSFCESSRTKNVFNINTDLCLILNSKLSSVTGESGADMIDPSKAPGICTKFKNGNIINFYIRVR